MTAKPEPAPPSAVSPADQRRRLLRGIAFAASAIVLLLGAAVLQDRQRAEPPVAPAPKAREPCAGSPQGGGRGGGSSQTGGVGCARCTFSRQGHAAPPEAPASTPASTAAAQGGSPAPSARPRLSPPRRRRKTAHDIGPGRRQTRREHPESS